MDEPARLNGDNDRQRVIVADSNPRVRSALILLLSRQPGFAVVGEYSTTENLVEYLAKARATILLLEWALAGPDPTTLLRDLRASRPGLVIIALSARPELYRQTLCAGVEAFVSKFDAPSSLLTTINDVITRHTS